MSDFNGFNKLNPGMPKRFLDAEDAQDWLPFGASDAEMDAKLASEPNTYLEWAHWYNAWEARGRDA